MLPSSCKFRSQGDRPTTCQFSSPPFAHEFRRLMSARAHHVNRASIDRFPRRRRIRFSSARLCSAPSAHGAYIFFQFRSCQRFTLIKRPLHLHLAGGESETKEDVHRTGGGGASLAFSLTRGHNASGSRPGRTRGACAGVPPATRVRTPCRIN